MKFRTKFEVVLQKQFLSVVANHPKSDFCTVNWVSFSEEIRQVYSTEILSNTATIRELNLSEIDPVRLKIVQRDTQNNRIHIRGRETRQTGNPPDEFPVLVWIRDEEVIWLTDMNSH